MVWHLQCNWTFWPRYKRLLSTCFGSRFVLGHEIHVVDFWWALAGWRCSCTYRRMIWLFFFLSLAFSHSLCNFLKICITYIDSKNRRVQITCDFGNSKFTLTKTFYHQTYYSIDKNETVNVRESNKSLKRSIDKERWFPSVLHAQYKMIKRYHRGQNNLLFSSRSNVHNI